MRADEDGTRDFRFMGRGGDGRRGVVLVMRRPTEEETEDARLESAMLRDERRWPPHAGDPLWGDGEEDCDDDDAGTEDSTRDG